MDPKCHAVACYETPRSRCSTDSESISVSARPFRLALSEDRRAALPRLLLAPVDSLVVYRADQQIALERRHFLFKLQDPIIENPHGRRLNRRDRPVKLAQGPSPSCADGRWRLYCSHVRSRKLGRNGVLARTDEGDSRKSRP